MTKAKYKADQILEFDNQDGTRNRYLKMAPRLSEFHKAYPPSEGWATPIEAVDFGRMTELRQINVGEYIKANGNETPSDFLAQKLNGVINVVFRGRLISPKGVVIEEQWTCAVVTQPKDWEKGVTACLQRVMAAAGYGSERFLDDEPTQEEVDNPPRDIPKPLAIKSCALDTPSAPAASSSTPVQDNDKQATQRAWTNVANQIRNIAATRGIAVEVPEGIAAAKSLLKSLMKPHVTTSSG